MGGSFESGAGDDPNDLFSTGGDEKVESDADQDQALESKSVSTEIPTDDTADQEGTETDRTEQEGSSVTSKIETSESVDAAHLARKFVPDTYQKSHAWALGRNGVNDGRSEKKTFFLQSSVLSLEAACSQQVNETLDGNVPLTDLRELALILAYHQPERLAEAAREWGSESA